MSRAPKVALTLAAAALLGVLALHTGLARHAFFVVFTYVKSTDARPPTVVREPPTPSPYERWLEQARPEMPVFEGLVIKNVHTVGLQPWPQMGEGVTGLYLRFADYQVNDGRILQIPASGSTIEQRHLYEKAVYILTGSGFTLLQQEGAPVVRVDWSADDLLAVPLNVRHSHHAASDGPARLIAITSFPLMMNVTDDSTFVTHNDYAFYGRYDGSPDYFREVAGPGGLKTTTNFVEEIRSTPTRPYEYKGKGAHTMRWAMAGNSMLSMHILDMPARNYMKAHRHSSEAFILLLSGEGFSLAWPEGAYDKRIRVDWQAGTLFVPPTFWYHQHLNTGASTARHLAINAPVLVRNLGLRFSDQLEIDADEVRAEFERALAR